MFIHDGYVSDVIAEMGINPSHLRAESGVAAFRLAILKFY